MDCGNLCGNLCGNGINERQFDKATASLKVNCVDVGPDYEADGSNDVIQKEYIGKEGFGSSAGMTIFWLIIIILLIYLIYVYFY